MLVFLGILAEVPHIAPVVLGEEREFLLLQPAFEEVPVPRHDRAHMVDHLRQVGDREHDAVRLGLPVLDDLALVDELGAGHEREHLVADGERRREPAGRVPGPGGWGGLSLLGCARARLPAPGEQPAREQRSGTSQGAGRDQRSGPWHGEHHALPSVSWLARSGTRALRRV
jgi:hypothetical protein